MLSSYEMVKGIDIVVYYNRKKKKKIKKWIEKRFRSREYPSFPFSF